MSITITGAVNLGTLTGGPSATNLFDLHDVSIVSPVTNQYLRYNAATSEWQNTYLSFNATGDALGTSVNGTIALTLATVNASPQTDAFRKVTVNSKGLVTATSPVAQIDITTALGYTPTNKAGDTMTGALTATQFNGSGAGLYDIPNSAFTNSSVTVGSTNIALGATATTLTGLASVTSTAFVGALSGNATTATTLATSRTISATGDAVWSTPFDGSANTTSALTLATVNGNVGQFAVSTVNAKGLVTSAVNLVGDITSIGAVATLATVNASPQTDAFRKVTVNSKGLVTATTAVLPADITTALGYTPVNIAGDTLTGSLILDADPSIALGAATKQYVDNIASGLNAHASSATSTGASLPASVYNNGTSGVGATLTASANGAIGSINGYAVAVSDRVLVKDQSTSFQNGIYVVTQLGDVGTPWILTRAADFDNSPTFEVEAGDFTYVQNGTLAGTQWVLVVTTAVTIGTTGLPFSQLSGAGSLVGGNGISVAGNVITNIGVTSNIAGAGISLSGATGAVTITNSGVTSVTGTSNQIVVSATTSAVTISLPSLVTISGTLTAGTLTGAHTGSGAGLTSIPNAALTNSSLTIGSTNIALGTTATTLAGLTSVTSTTFVGELSGNATTATTTSNIAGGLAGNINYQSAPGTTTLLTTGTLGQVLVSGPAPSWTNTPTLTGTNFTGIPNSAFTNSSLTIGLTNIALGATVLSLAGLTSLTATTITATTFNATSTKRVKKAIKNLSKGYLAKFAKLRPCEYDRKDYTAHEFGFIAEEMLLVYPEVVGIDADGKASGIDYGKLSTILTAKVQEQQAVIEKLQSQVATIMELVKGLK